VFAVIADASRYHEWTFMRRSWLDEEGRPPPDGVGALRRFGTFPVFSREEVVAFQPPRRLAYVLRSGMPVRAYRATVDLTPRGTGTDISWRGELEPFPGTGFLMARVVGRMLRGFATGAADRAERQHASATPPFSPQ
jgi:hypothetical protein